MEDLNDQDNKIIVKTRDILKKLKSPTDRKNFALENRKVSILFHSYFRLVYTKFERF